MKNGSKKTGETEEFSSTDWGKVGEKLGFQWWSDRCKMIAWKVAEESG